MIESTFNKMATRLFFVICISVIIALSEASCKAKKECKNKCFGKSIDLSKIIKAGTRVNGTGLDNNLYSFEFKLCNGVKCGSVGGGYINNAAVCQWKSDGTNGFSLGEITTVSWSSDDSSSFNVTYSGTSPNDATVRQAVLQFIHDESKKTPEIAYINEVDNTEAHTFYFTITGKSFGTGDNIAGPIGWSLIILALIGFIVYFVAGMIFMYFARGARGLEMIPNFLFWKSFPFLIVEGCLFVISPCRRLMKRGSDYEKI